MTSFSFLVVQSVKMVLTAAARIYQTGKVRRSLPATLKITDSKSNPIDTLTERIIIVIFHTSFVFVGFIIATAQGGVKCANSKEESIWK